ncbi:MAG: amino acid ABC transporter permease, partial [Hydrococcus sp. RM1_1_31]|nr:amino acid ABC transporter permease [Hydrococcus sp. RM1_1_31]
MTNQGVYLLFPSINARTLLSVAVLVLSAILAVIIWRRQTQVMVQQGQAGKGYQMALISIAIAAILIFIFGLDWQQPQYDRADQTLVGGLSLSPEFATLLVGLVVYTAA